MSPVIQHIFHSSTLLKAGASALALSAILSFAPLLYQMAEESYMPASHWFVYHKVEPIKDEFAVGERLRFYSTRTVNKAIRFEWSDALYCDFGDGQGFGTYSIYESANSAIIVPQENFKGPWTYHAPVPERSAICELRTAVTAKLKYRDKVQILKSERFRITD